MGLSWGADTAVPDQVSGSPGGGRKQVWLHAPVLAKLDRARALLGLEQGGEPPSRPQAVESALDRLLAELERGK
jgi:hypothetical protein